MYNFVHALRGAFILQDIKKSSLTLIDQQVQVLCRASGQTSPKSTSIKNINYFRHFFLKKEVVFSTRELSCHKAVRALM